MAEFNINLGDVFLISHSEIPHFYIVISPIAKDLFLLVNLTSRKPNSEAVCILEPSPQLPDFITCESVINYRQAVNWSSAALQKMIRQGSCKPRGNIGQDVLLRIQLGGLASKFLSNRYKEALRQIL